MSTTPSAANQTGSTTITNSDTPKRRPPPHRSRDGPRAKDRPPGDGGGPGLTAASTSSTLVAPETHGGDSSQNWRAPSQAPRAGRGRGGRGRGRGRGGLAPPGAPSDRPSSAGPSTGRNTPNGSSSPADEHGSQDARASPHDRPHPPGDTAFAARSGGAPSSQGAPRQPRGNRRAKFNTTLTDPDGATKRTPKEPRERYAAALPDPAADDLTSTLIRALSAPPYPDCPICFNAIHPAQPAWSCSPSLPGARGPGGHGGQKEVEDTQCCWTTFHLKCVREWAAKSVKDIADAWRARGESRLGEWRCPGCQAKRSAVPSGYWCFCGSAADPRPPRLSTPHSCASACSRSRSCGHACPLRCHPGPCPPCQVTTALPCHCCAQTLSFRCANLSGKAGAAIDLSCGRPCGKLLGCGNHKCEEICHDGVCKPCEVRERVRCYCGKEEREVGCGEGEAKVSVVEVAETGEKESWIGRFDCEEICDRPFACNIHHCRKTCHPPSATSPECPLSPSVLTHCPCGEHPLSSSASAFFPPTARLDRTACTDPVPTCTSLCRKPLGGCDHPCAAPCHAGACPPCTRVLVRPCRCGAIRREVRCAELQTAGGGAHGDVLCDRPCAALRACGRHRCNRGCCPLAALAGGAKGKGKRRGVQSEMDGIEDEGGLHQCDLVCGKALACGNHQCEERDHRGACPPCLRSSFDEMVCNCGRTVLVPPIACGTRIRCGYPCARPPPACGHSRTAHACHEDDTACPPCPFLTRKQCACGKKAVDNVRCAQEKVSCGTACGRLLPCGFHKCIRLCHGDDCGPCTLTCGKPRKLCLPAHHPCPHPCHAPSSCSEAEACLAPITLTCPCGRIRQTAPCGRSTASPRGSEAAAGAQIRCSGECAIAKRNARLAEALGIGAGADGAPGGASAKAATYAEGLVSYARANARFCGLVEKTFLEFVTSDKKTVVLPPMPPDRRKFVHDLAAVYRMDAQMVDQEPRRSVQLIRRIDTRIPTPLLSASAGLPAPSGSTSTGTGSNLGKLATDLRAPAVRAPVPAVVRPAAKPSGRGWTSVIAPSALATAPGPGPGPGAAIATPATRVTPRATPAPVPVPAALPAPVAAVVGAAPVQGAVEVIEDVPDNWEDDV